MPYVISRSVRLKFEPHRSSLTLEEELRCMLLELAEICSMKGIVPGHIKALIREKDAYALLSCTRAGNVNVKNSPAWREALLEHPELNLNVILADSPLDHVETLVERKLKQTFPGYQLLACAHQHLHDHVCAD